MTRDELTDRLENSLFEWTEQKHDGEDGLLIRCACPRCEGTEEATHVAFNALEDLTWPQIRSHVINGRHVSHITRVVGYFSRVENWNDSKKGELKDRQDGSYSVQGYA